MNPSRTSMLSRIARMALNCSSFMAQIVPRWINPYDDG
jgi:hypothetical protein